MTAGYAASALSILISILKIQTGLEANALSIQAVDIAYFAIMFEVLVLQHRHTFVLQKLFVFQ